MDKIKIGIPRSIYYYYFGDLWIEFFKYLDCEIIISDKTNKEIMNIGSSIANDEMCLSLKNFIGHVASLENRCDKILIPRIANYGISNQTCTNFLALYDLIHNLIKTPIINYNIDFTNHETEEKGFIKIGMELGYSKNKAKNAYIVAKEKSDRKKDLAIFNNIKKLSSSNLKLLVVGHPYNIYDDYIGKPILSYLNKLDVELIFSNLFCDTLTNRLSYKLSKDLYWKYNKENIGAIPLVKNKIDGVLFLSTFPCGPDSLVNELVIRRLKLPYLNLILDDLDSINGFETRMESFIDIVRERKKEHA